mgnify:CR=1 FL=1
MEKNLKLLKALILSLILVTAFSCSDNDDDNPMPQPTNIVEIAQATPDLSNLVDALVEANLTTTLSGNGPFTVLAPTNAAFQEFMSDNGWATVQDIPDAALEQVLLNHVISGTIAATDLMAAGSGYATTNADGAGGNKLSIYYDTTNGVKFNNTASVTTADIVASNGIIHIVDKVIGLPSVVDHAAANPNFSNLVAALSAADGDLVNVLSGDGPFTILAPDNAAFAGFLSDNGFSALGDVPTDVLAQVLLNHVMSGVTLSTDLTAAGAGYTNTLATGAGNNPMSLYFNTSDGVKFNGISNVTTADIVGTNGVIHAIDGVIGLPTVVDFALADPTFETLVAALTRDDLTFDYVSTLSTPNGTSPAPFTVFAPTNDAFASLLTELGVSSLADIDEPTLKATLDHHAVAGANVRAADLMDNMTVTTLGGDITANVTGGATLTDANGRVSNIIAVDVQAANGVIHVIDKVVLPPLN